MGEGTGKRSVWQSPRGEGKEPTARRKDSEYTMEAYQMGSREAGGRPRGDLKLNEREGIQGEGTGGDLEIQTMRRFRRRGRVVREGKLRKGYPTSKETLGWKTLPGGRKHASKWEEKEGESLSQR